ncbi:Beta-lactamase enzyme family protein [Flavobacterium anhuiense]|uniref:Beta-lactamase enzyme family protein n=1 Tax=Flavobacterium anhuiense TaxID=459526 RepID=A0ABY0LP37_9FLAO|nr:serine hydrolase [Flavobacterium anhuiense]SCY45649.1 Beta-lactamase enzyme family protein [Flavobacterium anhuiense]
MKRFFLIACVLCFFSGCKSVKNDPIKKVLSNNNDAIKKVADQPEHFELQIIYTAVKRKNNGKVILTDYKYNVDASNYYYPASTVKLPIAVLALEKLNGMKNADANTVFAVGDDETKFSFADDLRKIFAVSSNEASNDFYEFMGRDYINRKMKEKGLKQVRISHRLSAANSGASQTKKIAFYNNGEEVLIPSVRDSAIVPLKLNKILKGKGYYENGKLINSPMDFSRKNYLSLETLHGTMKRVVFPDNFPRKKRFDLSAENRELLLYNMQNLPRNAGYDPKEYYDGYCKFFMFGDTKETIPDNIKIYNKVGDAYGTLIDCAYIVDEINRIEFIISATLLVNEDQIFNDDNYDYDEIGLPFLAELGRAFYRLNLEKL